MLKIPMSIGDIFIYFLQQKVFTKFYAKWYSCRNLENCEDDECFCGIVRGRKLFRLISSWSHCETSSPSQISDTPWVGFESVQNHNSGSIEWTCEVVLTTTPRDKEKLIMEKIQECGNKPSKSCYHTGKHILKLNSFLFRNNKFKVNYNERTTNNLVNKQLQRTYCRIPH